MLPTQPADFFPQAAFSEGGFSSSTAVLTRRFRARMSPRLLLSLAILWLAVLLLPAALAAGQAGDSPESMLAQRQFVGAAVRDGVIIRSGASATDLSVAVLDAETEVIVVGVRGDFLRILPPEGTFCVVPKARVNVRGAAEGERVGRTTDHVSVRVGSTLNATIAGTALRLSAGEEVRVVGEDSSYYRIAPPVGVFFYVDKSELRKVREVRVTEGRDGWRVGELPTETPARIPQITVTPADGEADAVAQGRGETGVDPDADAAESGTTAAAGADQDEIDTEPVEIVPVVDPVTQPEIFTRFQEVDTDYEAAAELPLAEQPLDELRRRYAELLDEAREDATASGFIPVIEARIQTIDIRKEALQDLLAIQAMRQQMAQKQRAMQAEREELEELARGANIRMYRAIGELHASSLQVGAAKGVLFRLCDPETGRTVIYLLADAQRAKAMGGQIGKMVGVDGEVVRDPELGMRYISVSDSVAFAPEKLFDEVTAEILAPSLLEQLRPRPEVEQQADAGGD